MKKKYKIIIAVVAVLLAALAVIIGLVLKNGKTDNTAPGGVPIDPEAYYLPSGVAVNGLFSYTGAYVEDGSDEQVSGVAAVRLTNNSDTAWQTLRLKASAGEQSFEFFLTSFMPGDTVTVLESGRAEYDGKSELTSAEITESSAFEAVPSKHEDMFSVDLFDGVMNIKNISKNDLKNDVYVYYKNKDSSGYLGGITYRINFGALEAGKTAQRSSSHLSENDSEILFITYGE